MLAGPIFLTLTIEAPSPLVFSTITDLPGYNTWLPHSDVFKGTTEVSQIPIQQGTTYVERGPQGTRHGVVLELERSSKVVFSQSMTLKPELLGLAIGVIVTMIVREDQGKSVLERTVQLDIPLVLWLFRAIICDMFRTESWRALENLKVFAENKVGKLEIQEDRVDK
ncbi:hypothetical protein B7494_g5419 [Chlorociboria aeruginascens]|nr:hypothetical protein B7494_g5419 [Chlorociboria aeruginascens]